MRHKRPRRRAPGLGLHHRRFHLVETAYRQELPDRPDGLDPPVEQEPGSGIRDQIEITLAVARLGILEPVPFLRQRQERLGKHLPTGHLDGLLTGPGDKEFTIDADMITDIEQLECLESRLVQGFFLDIDLETVRSVIQIGKNALAHIANGGQAACRRHTFPLGERGMDIGQAPATGKRPAERGIPQPDQFRHIRHPLLTVLVHGQFFTHVPVPSASFIIFP